jgi:transcriptional regulator with XRE-family HTH domain
MTIGEQIKRLRVEKDWSQRELAEVIDVNVNVISLWERGKFEPSIFNCILLADVFDITLDELCCREV